MDAAFEEGESTKKRKPRKSNAARARVIEFVRRNDRGNAMGETSNGFTRRAFQPPIVVYQSTLQEVWRLERFIYPTHTYLMMYKSTCGTTNGWAPAVFVVRLWQGVYGVRSGRKGEKSKMSKNKMMLFCHLLKSS